MIVTCERCETQFQLDEARVPASGARVRCSRCKHAFVVQRPAATEEERVHDAAHQALDAGATPDVTRDLPAEKDENEESDWQFNDEREVDAAAASSDFGQIGPDEDLCLASEDEGGEHATAADSPPFERDESAFDSPTDPSVDLPIDRDPASEAEENPDLFSASASEADVGLDLASEPASEGEEGLDLASANEAGEGLELSSAPTSEAGSGSPSDELGSPDDWDLFDAPTRKGAPAVERVPHAPTAAPAAVATTREASGAEAPTPLAIRGSRAMPWWIAMSGRAGGWVATVGLCLFGFSRGLAPPVHASLESAFPAPGVALEDVESRWVDNVHLGKLFVVSGWMLRDAAGAASPPALELALLDAAGRVVAPTWRLAAAGSEAPLREVGSAALEARRAGTPRPLVPGEKRTFEVVAWPLPPEAERFEIRAAGGAP